MADALAGRVILVTGSSRGIGAEIAAKAGAQGATVAVHYNTSPDGADRTASRVREAGGQAEVFCADVSVGPQAERLVEEVVSKLGRIDGLVNNAGKTQVGPFLDFDVATWDHVIATDLSAAFHTCRIAIPHMIEQGGGSIVNIASRLAQMGIAETAAYSAAKSGLVGLTRALAREFGPRGIRVNAVAPGFTLTDMTQDLARRRRASGVCATCPWVVSRGPTRWPRLRSSCSATRRRSSWARRSTPTAAGTCRDPTMAICSGVSASCTLLDCASPVAQLGQSPSLHKPRTGASGRDV
jgi:3-oxoacyl-[acyl-carrier protein] reductase